jgi:AraC family transcriptional regulator of adaptative response / DNA-3-methyladenine glycosylase II
MAMGDEYTVLIRCGLPYAWDAMVGFFGPRATPGVEAVEGGVYRRTITWQGAPGWIEVGPGDTADTVIAQVCVGDPAALNWAVERIRAMFDLSADWVAITAALSGDAALRARMQTLPGLRVPGSWDGFELAVRAILGQQVTVKGATTLTGRLARKYGEEYTGPGGLTHLFPTPARLAEADFEGVGLPRARAATVRGLARAVSEGTVRLTGPVDTAEVVRRLQEIRGIGPWTAQYIAMRAFGDRDAFPVGDLGLLRALGLKSARELERRAEAWRPWRAYAVMYLWNVAGGG